MLRTAADPVEQSSALARLSEARDLMLKALAIIDETLVATDCDGYLDQAVHRITEAIADLGAGRPVFTGAGPRRVGEPSPPYV